MKALRGSAMWLGVLLLALTGLISGLGRPGHPSIRTAPLQTSTTLQFGSSNFNVGEGDQFVRFNVTRSGDASSAATVFYSTSDAAALTPCTFFTGRASERCDYATSVGTLRWAAGESGDKFITIPVVNDALVEGQETFTVTLSNPTGASLGSISTAAAIIQDDDLPVVGNNPIDGVDFFIRQQYIDFLGRLPDPIGFQNWRETLGACPNGGFGENDNPHCDRVHVSRGFFQSTEFLGRGYFAFRFYMVSFNQRPLYSQFIPDMAQVGGTNSPQEEELSKVEFSAAFVQRTEFVTRYGSTFNNPTAYVDALLQTAGVPNLSIRQSLIDGLSSGQKNRAKVLREIVESNEVFNKFLVDGTVAIQYFGYLRRDPDSIGYQNWVNTLSANPNNLRHMVFGFIYSDEYRGRFSSQLFVSAGADQTIGLPNNASLSGAVSSNGLPGGAVINVNWSVVSGPGAVTFNNANAPSTTASFSAAGTYTLRLTASHSSHTSADDVTITVNAAGTTSLTAEQRVATTKAVSAKFQSLINSNPDRNAVNQELLNFIRSRPEFIESGITPDSCVWATYTDGVGLVVINHDDLPDDSTVPATVSKSTGVSSISEHQQQLANVPTSNKARLLFALGSGWSNPIGEIRSWLNEQGYTAPIGAALATVSGLKTVGGDGVFYIDAHGATMGDETQALVTNGPYVVTTAEEINTALDIVFETDLKPRFDGSYVGLRRRLTHVVALRNVSPFGNSFDEAAATYGITDQFIRDYWGEFSANSFVFINACDSASPAAAGFMEAIKDKKASVYVGWSKSVGDATSTETAKFVFDRLLGANKVYPENDGFKQRPFDYRSVDLDLPQHTIKTGSIEHSLGYDPVTGAQLAFKTFTSGFTLLAPSIARMRVDEEAEQLIITGIFSNQKGPDSRVTVDGQELGCAESEWKNNEIKCHLPASGPGSSGDVIVIERGHKSNVAQLTEWEGDFVLSMNTDVGTHQQQGTIHVRLRADVRKWRPEIHKPPVEPDTNTWFTATMDSYLDYLCSGSSTYTYPASQGGSTETVIWSGAGRLPRVKESMVGDNFTLPRGHFVSSRKMELHFLYLASFVCTETTIDNSGNHQDIVPLLWIPLYLYPDDPILRTTQIDLDEGHAILPPPNGSVSLRVEYFPVSVAGVFEITGSNDVQGTVRLKWNRIEAKHPPNPDSPR